MRAVHVGALAVACALVVVATAQATPTVPVSALAAVQGMSSQTGLVTGGTYVLRPTDSTGAVQPTVATSSDQVLGMPSHGASYTVLSSGNAVSDMHYTGGAEVSAAYVNAPGTDAHAYTSGDINDLTVLKATVDVPVSDNCLSFDFRFLSQEFPYWVGQFNDGLIVQLDRNDWTSVSVHGGFTAPGNFAFDASGQPLSVNSTGLLGMSVAGAAGTGFASTGSSVGGGTALLSAHASITPGSHAVYFSIFDQGDHSLDTGALIDNLSTSFVPGGCSSGAVVPLPPPSAPVITSQPSATPSDTGIFTFVPAAGDTVVASYECSIDGGGYVACASGDAFDAGLRDGIHTFAVRADNAAGQAGPAQGPVSWTIARTPPPPPGVSGAPPAPTTATTATLTLSGVTNATFACKLDAAAYAPCTPSAGFSNLSLGTHTVLVRQTDTDGNTSTDTTVTWQVIPEIPQAPQIAGDPLSGPSDSGIFAFTPAAGDTSVASYACSIDGGAFAPCASGDDLDPGLLDGTHTLSVHALNVSAQSGPDTGPVSWVIARTPPPAPTITGTPPASSPATTADITFTGVPGATFACSIDSGPFGPCTSPTSFSGLGAGGHTVLIHQTDLNGNTSTDTSISFTVTPPPPLAPDITAQPSVSPSDSGVFGFAPGDRRLECRELRVQSRQRTLRGVHERQRRRPRPARRLHTFSVRGIDSIGQHGPSSTSRELDDRAHPSRAADDHVGSIRQHCGDGREHLFSGVTGASFVCKLDGAAYAPCTSPASYSGLALGSHTMRVRQTDLDGNTGSDAAATWVVTAPLPLAPEITAEPSVTPSDTGIYAFSPGLGDSASQAIPAASTPARGSPAQSGADADPGLLDGTHTFAVSAENATGHRPCGWPGELDDRSHPTGRSPRHGRSSRDHDRDVREPDDRPARPARPSTALWTAARSCPARALRPSPASRSAPTPCSYARPTSTAIPARRPP